MITQVIDAAASSEPPPVANPPLTRAHFNESYIHLTDEQWQSLRRECQLGEQIIQSLRYGREHDSAAASLLTLMVGLETIINRRFSRKPCTWRNDDELPMVEIIDLLTGERTETCDHSFAGGFHAALWCVHRLMRVEVKS